MGRRYKPECHQQNSDAWIMVPKHFVDFLVWVINSCGPREKPLSTPQWTATVSDTPTGTFLHAGHDEYVAIMCINNLNITCKLSQIIDTLQIIQTLRKIRDYNRYHYVRPQKVANVCYLLVRMSMQINLQHICSKCPPPEWDMLNVDCWSRSEQTDWWINNVSS